jgi:hypothetical protein
MLPPCFPPVATVRRWFSLWRDNGLRLTLNHTLMVVSREAQGREASPSAGVRQPAGERLSDLGRHPLRQRRRAPPAGAADGALHRRCARIGARKGEAGRVAVLQD